MVENITLQNVLFRRDCLRTYRADSVQQSKPLRDRTIISPEEVLMLDGRFDVTQWIPRAAS